MTEFGYRALQQLRQHFQLAQVGFQAQETTPQCGDFGNGFVRLNHVNANDITTRLSQPYGHPLSQPGVTTGHNRHFTLQ
ncbi:hypothetical protein D3C75_1199570 [compost metagenome]